MTATSTRVTEILITRTTKKQLAQIGKTTALTKQQLWQDNSCCLVFTFSTKSEIRHFHVVYVQ